MPVSKTGSLRQAVPSIKRGLQNRIASTQDLLSALESLQPDAALKRLKLQQKDLQTSISKFAELDVQWRNVLDSLTEEVEQNVELQHYADIATSSSGFHVLVEQAESLVNQVEIEIQERMADRVGQDDVRSNRSFRSVTSNSKAGPSPRGALIKQPKLTLPMFDGSPTQFNYFWSIFDAAIHQRSDLSGVAKFAYLLPQLTGKAKSAIDGLFINNENYEVAVDILHQRFDQTGERLVSILYGELKRVPRCGKLRDDKRKTFDACERIFRQLEHAGEDLDSNRSVSFDLLSKFPSGMVRDLHRHYHVSAHSIPSMIREAINKSITELEETAGVLEDLEIVNCRSDEKLGNGNRKPYPTRQVFSRDAGYNRYSSHRPNQDPITNTVMTAVTSRIPLAQPPGKCYFCDGDHFNTNCIQFPTWKARVAQLRKKNRCTRCTKQHNLGNGQCRTKIRCFHCHTFDDHYTPLCRARYPENRPQALCDVGSKSSQATKFQVQGSNGGKSTDVHLMTAEEHRSRRGSSLFQTAKTQAINPQTGKRVTVRVSLDTLSSRTYITTSKARSLGLSSTGSANVRIKVFNSGEEHEASVDLVSFGLLLRDGTMSRIYANTIDLISDADVLPPSWPKDERALLSSMVDSDELADDPFDSNRTLDVLLGADYVWDFIQGGKVDTHTSVSFVPTSFGLMLCGRLLDVKYGQEYAMLCLAHNRSPFADATGVIAAEPPRYDGKDINIEEYWKLESMGITDSPTEDDDAAVMQHFKDTVAFKDGRYYVTQPWIHEKLAKLPSNFDVAFRRFRGTTARLASDRSLLERYSAVINQQVERGIVEQVPESQLVTPNVVHYLPHHPVVKESSATTKLRIVYDASAKPSRSDTCLNECVARGPVLLPDLCQLLIRTRLFRTLVISDIEKAFLQVALQEQERDATRFLWFRDDKNPTANSDNIAMFRFCRVPFGIRSSPFLLGATIQHHLESDGSPFALRLSREFYVDNLISGVDDMHPLVYYHRTKKILASAGMNLQEYCSNSADLMNGIPECDRVKSPDVKLLGLKWDSSGDDSFRLAVTNWSTFQSVKLTKRCILKAIASVFDPLGWYQPVMFPCKLLLRELWDQSKTWDAVLSTEYEAKWSQLLKDVEPIFSHRIPRFVGSITSQISLAVFSDASERGYGAAVYARVLCGDSWTVSLLFAKSRLTPPKRTKPVITLPRLELLGATVAARAGQFCRQALGGSSVKIDFFIDSECVLHWIRSSQPLRRFVGNRVSTIREVQNCEFHYICSALNPADHLTRGRTGSEIVVDQLWWHGPSFLQVHRSDWPKTRLSPITDEGIREIVSSTKPSYVCHVAQVINIPTGPMGMDAGRFSSLNRLIRSTCVQLKFLKRVVWDKLRTETKGQHPNLSRLFGSVSADRTITADDYDTAMLLWVKHIQQAAFSEQFSSIAARRSHCLVSQLGLVVDGDGYLRAVGRFKHADVPEDVKYPLMLPRDHPFTVLIVKDVHNQNGHAGPSHTLCQVRRRFWFTHGRSLVNRVLHRCVVCKKSKTAVSFALPPMPPWPRERVSRSAPFQFAGVDYFGPIKVRVRDETTKMWACLFTCLATRAVHLEPVSDCTPAEFLSSLSRFVSRRGCPQKIYSDNAAQFQLAKILADRAWKTVPTDDNILSYSSKNGIAWKFSVELAPWQGGHYERLVGVVKSVLKTVVARRILSWTDFVTVLIEAEAIVNSRPLTYVGQHVEDQFRVIRPIDFLVFRPVSMHAEDACFPVRDLGDSGRRLVSVWKQRERYINKLWERWYDQYLSALRERGSNRHRNSRGAHNRCPREGEVVMLRDDDLPRGAWKLVRIVKLMQGSDGRVRAAEIRLPNGYHIRRAVNFLFPLEVDQPESSVAAEASSPESEYPGDESASRWMGVEDDDEDEFLGFTPHDIRRTVDTIRMFDNAADASSGTY